MFMFKLYNIIVVYHRLTTTIENTCSTAAVH